MEHTKTQATGGNNVDADEEEQDEGKIIRTRSDDQGPCHGESQRPAAADQVSNVSFRWVFVFVVVEFDSLSVTSRHK